MSDFKFEFGRPKIKDYSDEEILEELEKVAKHFKYNHFLRKDFDKVARIHSATVERRFGGSWAIAMNTLKERLERKNISLASSRRRNVPEKVMFDEMERIWRQMGHRPSRSEWTVANPKVSYDTIYRHFGGWTAACLKFIEFKSGESLTVYDEAKTSEKSTSDSRGKGNEKSGCENIVKARTIPLNIRVKVLSRDNFRCVFCGKSPATDAGVKLHVDHIVPFSRGGTNSLDNLQSLCEQCNLGKSNSIDLGSVRLK